MNADKNPPLDPLDALLENALRESSGALARPESAAPFRAQVAERIARHERRFRWLRTLPWTLGSLATVAYFALPSHSPQLPQLLAHVDKLPPLPSVDLLSPTLLAQGEMILSALHVSPVFLAETVLAILAAVLSTVIVRRQSDFRW